jgi:hypothetical protein
MTSPTPEGRPWNSTAKTAACGILPLVLSARAWHSRLGRIAPDERAKGEARGPLWAGQI